MKKWKVLAMAFFAIALVACGSGGGGGTTGGGAPDGGSSGPSALDAGSISGIVTDSQSGFRIQGVQVSASGKSVQTNDNGEFTLADDAEKNGSP